MFEDLPIACNVVHSEWVQDIYVPWYGSSRIRKWAVGIDTERWAVSSGSQAKVDFLIYDKILWEADRVRNSLLRPMLRLLDSRGLTWATIKYGSYRPDDLRLALSKAKALLFLCEHESQGLAYQQAMSSGVPVLAWSPGQWLDPVRFACGEVNTASTSVPFFDERCGVIFSSLLDFPEQLEVFCDKLRRGVFRPRDYVLENLTLAGCALRYVHILREFNA